MTTTDSLLLIGVVVVAVALYLFVRVTMDLRQRVVISIARPTTTDGETCSITANLRASAPAQEISETIEKASLAIQARIVRQNEIVAETDAEVAHRRWLKIRRKLDDAAKQRRTGPGVLSKSERAWWREHEKDFDEHGPIVQPERVAEAARGESEAPEG